MTTKNKTVEPDLTPTVPMEVDVASVGISPEEIMNNPATLKTALHSVVGDGSTGMAYVLRLNGKLYHFVRAMLPEPLESHSYEGWLVKQQPELEFFSTGVMEQTVEGEYTLMYMSDESSEGYNQVVITLESIVDETPETHIIEGTF